DPLIPAVAAANRGSPAGTPARLPGLAGAGLLDRRHEVALAHPGPPGDVELAGDGEQVRLGGVGVDPARGGSGGLAATAGGLPVAGTLAALGLPVVAHLLEGVLQCRVRGLVGAPPLAVRLDRGVVRPDPGLLRLLRRPLDGAGELLASRHGNLPTG